MAAEEILERSREDVVDSRTSVGGGRTLEEHELGRAIARLERAPEEVFPVPAGEDLTLEVVRIQGGGQRTIARAGLRRRHGRHIRSSMPRTMVSDAVPRVSPPPGSVPGSRVPACRAGTGP